jgi:hypothetical protein
LAGLRRRVWLQKQIPSNRKKFKTGEKEEEEEEEEKKKRRNRPEMRSSRRRGRMI